MTRDDKELLYQLLETARCRLAGYGRPEPAPVTFIDDPDTSGDTIDILAA
ncbi:MAG: hypothetical protein GX290_05975, partial [Treponema sp.]|nr:hypothetical protein [Treponema sp.]